MTRSELFGKKNFAPWVTLNIRKLMRSKRRLHTKFKKTQCPKVLDKYKEMRHTLQREIRKSYWAYIEDIIDYTAATNNDRQTKQKKFWSYIKHLRKDSTGVSPLRSQGETFSDAPRKAKILNDQFSSVFTKETPGPLPDKGPSPHPSMPNITISTPGIQKLLANLKPHKATGPDLIPPTVLKELSHEISPILEIIFNMSLQTGQVPNDWKEANIAPIFKKGDKHSPSNYRPVSLTCIIAKCMEHILVSNMMKHLELNNILHPLQHGFRKNYSCETQLLSLFQDLASNPSQIDLIIMDFSKAFDKVPHRRLNYKLDWYGIRGNTREWILDFLSGRSQRVVLEGASSDSEPVVSGVPQGTVLGPVLFLLYINDLPDVVVHRTARLFADDCIVYRPIRNNDDTILLQNDLNKIAEWEFMWQMQFNIDKCFILRVGRPKHKLVHSYTLHNQNLSETDSAKYLGLTITSDLQWNQHINNVTNKANSILGLLRRNLRIPSQTIKTHAYQSLVRPNLEYASTVWDPHTQKNIHRLDMVQRRAARYTCNRYHNISSVTEMVGHLGWEPLATRRRNMRLCMMYKIAHTVVGDPWTEWMTTSKRVTRGFHAWKYIPIYSHHNIYKFSFLPRTIIDWNSLSPHSVDSPSIDTFRARITRN